MFVRRGGDGDADAVEPKLTNASAGAAVLPLSEFYDALRAYTTRREVELIVDNALKMVPKKHENGASDFSEKCLRQMVEAEVRREVSHAVRRVVLEALHQQEEADQRQCGQILSHMREMEQRINAIQRQVNELSHGHRRAYKLLSQLCNAIEGGIAADHGPTSSPVEDENDVKLLMKGLPQSRLLDELLHALETDRLDEARVLLTASLAPFVGVVVGDQRQEQHGEQHQERWPRQQYAMETRQRMACTASAAPSTTHIKCGITPSLMMHSFTVEGGGGTAAMSTKVGMASPGVETPKGQVGARSLLNAAHPYASMPNTHGTHDIRCAEAQPAIHHPFGHDGPHREEGVKVENRVSPTLGIEAVDAPVDMLPAHLRGDACNYKSIGSGSSGSGGGGGGGGVRVLSTVRSGIAARSGVLAGDLIYAVGHHRVSTCGELLQALEIACAPHGDSRAVVLSVYRHRVRGEVEVVLT